MKNQSSAGSDTQERMTSRQWAEKILENRHLWEGKESFIQIVGDEIEKAIQEALLKKETS